MPQHPDPATLTPVRPDSITLTPRGKAWLSDNLAVHGRRLIDPVSGQVPAPTVVVEDDAKTCCFFWTTNEGEQFTIRFDELSWDFS